MTIEQITAIAQGIIEHMSETGAGYCDVPSNSKPGVTYRVYFNAKLYSTSCDCKAGSFNQDCGHRVAVDRHFDSRRSILTEDVAPHIEEELRNSCCTCGRPTKQIICGICLGE